MLLDVLVLSSGQNSVKVPLSSTSNKEKIVVIVKSLGRDEVKVGSISLPQELFTPGDIEDGAKFV